MIKPYRGLMDKRTPCKFIRDFNNTYTLLTNTPVRCDVFVACIDKSQCTWLQSALAETFTSVDVSKQLLERYWSPERRSLVWNQFMYESFDTNSYGTFDGYVDRRYQRIVDTTLMSEADILEKFREKMPVALTNIVIPANFELIEILKRRLQCTAAIEIERR